MHGNGSPRRCEGRLNRSLSRLCLPAPARRRKRPVWPTARPPVSTIPSGVPFLPAHPEPCAPRMGRSSMGSPARAAQWRWRMRRSTCRRSVRLRRWPRRCSRQAAGEASCCRAAPLGAFEPDETATISTPRDRSSPAPPCRSRSARYAPPCARNSHPRLGKGAKRRNSAGGARRANSSSILPSRRWSRPRLRRHALAGDLAALIDDMIIEGAPWTRLETLAPDLYDPYSAHHPRFSQDRLCPLAGLARRARPHRPGETDRAPDRGRDQGARGIATRSDHHRGLHRANRATARLIAAIARAPQGAVVLPGLDLNLDDRTWAMIGATGNAAPGLAGHPQALLHRLIGAIGVRREDAQDSQRALACARGALRLPERSAPSRRVVPTSGVSARWTLSPLALAAAFSRRHNHGRRQRD